MKVELSDALGIAAARWFEELDDRGVFITDERLIVRRWNHWLEAQTGRSARDVVGQPPRLLGRADLIAQLALRDDALGDVFDERDGADDGVAVRERLDARRLRHLGEPRSVKAPRDRQQVVVEPLRQDPHLARERFPV